MDAFFVPARCLPPVRVQTSPVSEGISVSVSVRGKSGLSDAPFVVLSLRLCIFLSKPCSSSAFRSPADPR